MTAPDSLASTRPRRGGARRHLVAIVAAVLLLFASAAPAASIGLGSPATLDEVLESPGYDTSHSDVLRLYQAFFEREPDVTGATYWIEQYEASATLDDLAYGFAQSTEFINRYGTGLSNRAFLEIVYGNVLGRTPDTAGLDYWTGELDGGLSQHGVVRWVAANDEFASAYPFTPALTPVTAAAFIGSDALPADWSREAFETVEPDDRDTCNGMVLAPGNSVVVTYTAPDEVAFLEQSIAVYESIAEAESAVQAVREYPGVCPDFIEAFGDRLVPTPLTLRPVGDSSASIRETVTTAGTTSQYERHLSAFRIGRVFVMVWTSAQVGDPATFLDAAVDVAEINLYADLS